MTASPSPSTTPPAAPAASTLEDLVNAILKTSGLDGSHIAKLKIPTRCTAAGLAWEVNKPKMNDPNLLVLFMFKGSQGVLDDDHVAGDVRIYAAPTANAGEKLPPFACFTASRIHPTYVGESMGGDAFIRTVGNEFRELALLELDVLPCEGDDCDALTNADAEKCRACGAALNFDEGDDEEGGDADVEDEEMPAPPITSIGGVSLRSPSPISTDNVSFSIKP